MFLQLQEYYIEQVFNDTIFLLYLVSLIVDLFTGNIVAIVQRKWNSKTGINGTLRHFALFTVVGLLLPTISYATNISSIANGVLLYVILQYTISILENLSALGLDVHEGFAQYFEFLNPERKEVKQLDKKGEQNEDSE